MRYQEWVNGKQYQQYQPTSKGKKYKRGKSRKDYQIIRRLKEVGLYRN